MSKTWVYHKTEKAKIIDESEAESYYDTGWEDTPAVFDKKSPVQGMAARRIQENEIKLEEMTKANLREYAKKHLNVEIKESFNKDEVIRIIKASLNTPLPETKTGYGSHQD